MTEKQLTLIEEQVRAGTATAEDVLALVAEVRDHRAFLVRQKEATSGDGEVERLKELNAALMKASGASGLRLEWAFNTPKRLTRLIVTDPRGDQAREVDAAIRAIGAYSELTEALSVQHETLSNAIVAVRLLASLGPPGFTPDRVIGALEDLKGPSKKDEPEVTP
jgi:hypothetical protein